MTSEFSPSWIESQKGILLKLKSELMNQMKSRGNEDLVLSPDQYAEEGDQAQANQDQSLSFGLRDKDMQRLREIEFALDRIEEGVYGYCEESDEPISKKRLEKIPWARYSIDSQEKLERAHGYKRIA